MVRNEWILSKKNHLESLYLFYIICLPLFDFRDIDGKSFRTPERKCAFHDKRYVFRAHAYPVTETDSGANYIEVPFYKNGSLGKPRVKSSVTINPVKQKREKHNPCKMLSYSSADGRPQTPSGYFEHCGVFDQGGRKKMGLETVKEESEENLTPKGVRCRKNDYVDHDKRSPSGFEKSPIGSELDSLISIGDSEGCATSPQSPLNLMRADVNSTGDSGFSEYELSSDVLGKNALCNNNLAPPVSPSPTSSPISVDSSHATHFSPDSAEFTCHFSAGKGLVLKESLPCRGTLQNDLKESGNESDEDFPPPPQGECCGDLQKPERRSLDVMCKPDFIHPSSKVCHEQNLGDIDTESKPDKISNMKRTVSQMTDIHGNREKSPMTGTSIQGPTQFCNPHYGSLSSKTHDQDDVSDLPFEPVQTANFKVNPLYDVPTGYQFLPADVVEHYCYEGAGSPSISLSSIDSKSSEVTGIDPKKISELGEKFKRLAKVYRVKHVSFSPKHEIIKDPN